MGRGLLRGSGAKKGLHLKLERFLHQNSSEDQKKVLRKKLNRFLHQNSSEEQKTETKKGLHQKLDQFLHQNSSEGQKKNKKISSPRIGVFASEIYRRPCKNKSQKCFTIFCILVSRLKGRL